MARLGCCAGFCWPKWEGMELGQAPGKKGESGLGRHGKEQAGLCGKRAALGLCAQ